MMSSRLWSHNEGMYTVVQGMQKHSEQVRIWNSRFSQQFDEVSMFLGYDVMLNGSYQCLRQSCCFHFQDNQTWTWGQLRVISSFCHEVDENCSLLGPTDCPEMSVRNDHYSLCNNPEEHSSHEGNKIHLNAVNCFPTDLVSHPRRHDASNNFIYISFRLMRFYYLHLGLYTSPSSINQWYIKPWWE